MNRLNRIALCAILLLATKVIGGESPGEAGISARRFTLEQAIITALQQNPDILRARQEIERTKGLFIQLRAAAMPQITADARFQDLDPHLTHMIAPSTISGGETAGQAIDWLARNAVIRWRSRLIKSSFPAGVCRGKLVLPVSSGTAATTGFATQSIR